MLNSKQKSNLIILVAMCNGFKQIDKIVEVVNKAIRDECKEILICNSLYTRFKLVKREEGGYTTHCVIDDERVVSLDDKVVNSFTEQDYLMFMSALKDSLPAKWEENLRYVISTELDHAEIKYHRTLWGTVKSIEVIGKYELTKLFEISVYSGAACYGVCAKYDITPWCHFATNILSRSSVVSQVVHDTWFRFALSFYGQNGKVNKKDMGYHINLLSIGLTKYITESIHCIKL